jgi:hypothetical protein
MSSAFENMNGNPLLGLTRDGDKRFKVIETKRCPIVPRSGLILELAGEGRCGEWALLAEVLPDRRFDVAVTQPVRGFVVSCVVEMKLALSQEEAGQRTFHGGNTSQRP